MKNKTNSEGDVQGHRRDVSSLARIVTLDKHRSRRLVNDCRSTSQHAAALRGSLGLQQGLSNPEIVQCHDVIGHYAFGGWYVPSYGRDSTAASSITIAKEA